MDTSRGRSIVNRRIGICRLGSGSVDYGSFRDAEEMLGAIDSQLARDMAGSREISLKGLDSFNELVINVIRTLQIGLTCRELTSEGMNLVGKSMDLVTKSV